jgi:hypothetical protein
MPTAGASPTIFSLNGTTLQVKEGLGAAVKPDKQQSKHK